jgi:hypothetical protein
MPTRFPNGLLPHAPLRTVTGAVTLTINDDGKTVLIDSTTSRIITLPAASLKPGFAVRVVVKTAATGGAGHSVAPIATNQIRESSITPADNKSLINTLATGKSGDSLYLISDGSVWIVVTKTGVWARQA